jgi:cyclic pyranopterin phosphate synthase
MARPIHSLLVSVPTLDRLQRPLRDLRISVIETCNFRCPYCMPEDRYPQDEIGDRAGRLDFDEIERIARAFAQTGVRKLRLTGGEPLLRRGLPELVARLVRIEGIEDLALTTNGSLLARHARALREAGLQRLTISLDTLDPGAVPPVVRRARRVARRAGRYRRSRTGRLWLDQVQLRGAARRKRG